ncbi:hypothetical protein [Rhodococcus sp. 114MFTsu3.1]|uniref:hypothetical protein n=1 Tax=Rhodococcus sp. 114MFTsu3.1 TaxID=1172184 RepID=UPI00035C6952|nr:hypothetical protein [Rhodococcus sp. 114MFTsu3.1]
MNNPVPISELDQKRFTRELMANSESGELTCGDLEAALSEFIGMNVTAAAISMWHRGELKFGWSDGQMVWSLP